MEIDWDRMADICAKERADERAWEKENKGFKLKLLDIVKTKRGTLAVVSTLSDSGKFKRASLTFAGNPQQKVSWYHPSELRVIGNVKDWAKLMEKK
tara:strand:+ start:42 stop:329 length:288 start_codon:yes stop_codon:yes gene_type:complete